MEMEYNYYNKIVIQNTKEIACMYAAFQISSSLVWSSELLKSYSTTVCNLMLNAFRI